jgi:site-specific recombinase XerD
MKGDTITVGSSSIIIRMSAIRKLAAEAADNGLLAPELAAGISRVKSAKSVGIRMGNWLSARQAQTLLNTPDITTLKGLRDRAILAVLLGCGLRRSEAANLGERVRVHVLGPTREAGVAESIEREGCNPG